jgi:hypothetical protein
VDHRQPLFGALSGGLSAFVAVNESAALRVSVSSAPAVGRVVIPATAHVGGVENGIVTDALAVL